MASQGQQPAMPESVWMPFIGDAFPNLERQTYFVPPLHFNHVPFCPKEVSGQTVQVLEYPAQQAKKRRPKKPPPAESDPQVAGGVFTANPAGLKQARVVTTDAQDDYAHGYTLECLRVMAERKQEVMMVVSQLRFKKYLDKKTNPVHVAMAALLPNPLSLPTQIQDGECDVLILHPRYGLVVGEVKSVGSGPYFLNASPAEQDQIIGEKVRRGVEQLNNQSTILTHLVSDLGVRVTVTLILPNVTAARLRQVLSADPTLMQDLIQCLGGGDLPSTLTKCLCKDSMPESQLLQLLSSAPLEVSSRWTHVRHAVRNHFRSLQDRLQAASGAASNSPSSSSSSSVSSERCLVSLCGWWKERVVKRGRDPAMSPDVYRRLVARFCGPATTIEIPTSSRPAKEIRTHGQAVAEAGLRISRLALYPSQVDLLNSTFSRAQCVYLQGPPGTGKTVTLVLKALQWLNQGSHVWLLSIWPPARAITSVIHCQILASLTPPGAGGGGGGSGGGAAASSVGVPNLLCRYYDLKNKPEEADDVVKDLTVAAAGCGGDLNVIIDEVELVNKKHRDLLKEIVDAIPTASLWAAGLYTLPTFPPWLHPEPLTHPLRCPPTVHRQVAENTLLGSVVLEYTPPPVPPVTEGPAVRWLKHLGQPQHTAGPSCQDCAQCGQIIVTELRKLGVGQLGQLQYRDVFLLTKNRPNDNTPMVCELRRHNIPVKVVTPSDPLSSITAVALAQINEVVVTDHDTISGLERRVVFGMDDQGRIKLWGMSRCTAQLYWFDA